jgi:phospholipid transport system substrate-binding protein
MTAVPSLGSSSFLSARSALRALGLCFGLLLGGGALLHAQPARAASTTGLGPRATLQKLNGDVDKLLRAKTVPGSDEEQRVKNDIKQRASELLDYAELCKRALGEHWPKMPAKQRDEFVATLRDLIERNYVKQLRTNLDYDVKYGDEEIKGKSTTATIDYRLIQHDNHWMVYDVITDELSLVRNYRSTFVRIINSSGYDGLLNKMKTKLSDERARDAKDEQERQAKKNAPATAPAATPATAPAAAPSPKN